MQPFRYEKIWFHPLTGVKYSPLASDTQDRYPHVVEMPLDQSHFPRDSRKVWLYDTFKNSRWVTEDMHRVETQTVDVDSLPAIRVPLINTETRWPVRLFRFVDQQEALLFQLRWCGKKESDV